MWCYDHPLKVNIMGGVPELRFVMMNIGMLWLMEVQNLGISEQQLEIQL